MSDSEPIPASALLFMILSAFLAIILGLAIIHAVIPYEMLAYPIDLAFIITLLLLIYGYVKRRERYYYQSFKPQILALAKKRKGVLRLQDITHYLGLDEDKAKKAMREILREDLAFLDFQYNEELGREELVYIFPDYYEK